MRKNSHLGIEYINGRATIDQCTLQQRVTMGRLPPLHLRVEAEKEQHEKEEDGPDGASLHFRDSVSDGYKRQTRP